MVDAKDNVIADFLTGFSKFVEEKQLERAKKTREQFEQMNDKTLAWIRDTCIDIMFKRQEANKCCSQPESKSRNSVDKGEG